MRQGMTPVELRSWLRGVCDSLNDDHGTGGQSELARRLGWDGSTVRRKLAGKVKISRSDELAIRAVTKEDRNVQ
ncbi:hypothetical protein [Zavarzinella formosa]|uniref:hypothetical protein n=1 Tax=Zavarzinella formosa TaxID=360055 RepID=UPI0002DBAE67|nr:hypothetical protein [Zavarzinella formosa]